MKSSIAFISSCAFLFILAVLIALVLQCTNPPRLEARHPSLPPVGVRKRDDQVNAVQYPAPAPTTETSQLPTNPLNRAQPAASMSSQTLSMDPFENDTTKQPFVQSSYGQLSQPTVDATAPILQPVAETGRYKKTRSRALPQPPVPSRSDHGSHQGYYANGTSAYNNASATGYSDVGNVYNQQGYGYGYGYGYGTGTGASTGYTHVPNYAYPYEGMYQDASSPFNAYEVSAPVRGQASYQSHGYVPLPVPSASQPYGNYQDPNTFNSVSPSQHWSSKYNDYSHHRPLARHASQASSGKNSHLSRVDSVGAGDYRRHSQRRRNRKSEADTTLEKSQPRKSFADTTGNKQAPTPYSYDPGFSVAPNETFAVNYSFNEDSHYPLRDEYKYSQPELLWNSDYTNKGHYNSYYDAYPNKYQHRYDPF